jgi:GH25 family lysozyme M1 (1,4-beta-N-acetylmuramidase)
MTTGLAIPDATPPIASAATTATTATTTTTTTTTATKGVDVSSLQHPGNASIDWADVAAAGNAFTGIKASEGDYYTNPYFASDVEQATAAGLYVIPYAFANPFDPAQNGTAQQQADTAVVELSSVGSAATMMLPLELDLEPDPYASQDNTNQCYGLSTTAMRTWIADFITEVDKKLNSTRPVIIYTEAGWWNTCTGNDTAFRGYPLWLASYGVSDPSLPAGWNNYTFWQYSNNGTVNGVTGPVDLDYLGPVLQVSQVGKAIAPVLLNTLTSLNGQSVSYSQTGLPPGLTMSSSGQITGTPTTAGQYTVTVTPSAGAAPSTMTFTWDVHGTISVHSPGNRTTTAGTPVGVRVTVADTDPATFSPSFTASGLPPGLSISPAGVISGWPWRPGTYKGAVSASDGLYASGSAAFTWTVKAAADSGSTGTIRQWGGSGKCLDDLGSKTANGAAVDLRSCTGKPNQSWTFAQDGTIRVLGRCLNVTGGSRANGAKLELYTCDSAAGAQHWQVGADSELVNPQSGKCLYVAAANAANGTRPELWTCANSTGAADEHWLRPAASVYSGNPGECLAVSGSAVVLARCANASSQHWTQSWDGTLRLGSKCLTETGTTLRSVLSVGSCSGAAATKWQPRPAGPIATELASSSSGLCVTAPSIVSGVKLVLGTCAATQATTWHAE